MFKKKPVIKVIAVTHETREIKTEVSMVRHYSVGHEDRKSTEKINYTIILASKDGELFTREFNGKWSLEQIKSWEEI